MAALPPAVSFPWPEKKQKGLKTAETVLSVENGTGFQTRFAQTGNPFCSVPDRHCLTGENDIIC